MKADGTPKFLRLFLFFGVLAGTTPVFADEAGTLSVDKSSWRVGMARLSAGYADPGLSSAASLLPRLVRDELIDIREHVLTPGERRHLAEELIAEEVQGAYDSLASLHEQRDDLFFDPNTDPAEIREQDGKIAEAGEALARWRSCRPESVAVAEILPVEFIGPPEGGDFWPAGDSDPELSRVVNGLDVLVSGTVVRVGDYFGIRILAVSPTGTEVLWEGAAEEASLEDIAADTGAAARTLLLGRPWSALTVNVEPADAVISLDGIPRGVGFWSDSTLIPGSAVLEIGAPGYRSLVRNAVLGAGEKASLHLVLQEGPRQTVLVRSVPPGADIRLGGIWMGRTPLPMDVPDRVMPLFLEMEGFRSRTVPLYPDGEKLTVPLENAVADPAAVLDASRRKLHNSIALFAVSIAPTMVLMGVSQNYWSRYETYYYSTGPDSDTLQSYYDSFSITRGFMWGSLGVNVLLLGNVLFRLSRYLKAAEGLSEG